MILSVYAGDFDNDGLGAEIASEMIDKKADVLYAAAGFRVGMLKEAEKNGVYAMGVDSDQYFLCRTSRYYIKHKNIDSALFGHQVHSYKESGAIQSGHIKLGQRKME